MTNGIRINAKSSCKVEQMGAPYSCLYASSMYIIQGWLELCHTWPAGFSSIYVCHWAALTQPHCAYNQKLGAPIRSTLPDDFVQM